MARVRCIIIRKAGVNIWYLTHAGTWSNLSTEAKVFHGRGYAENAVVKYQNAQIQELND